MKKFSKYLRTCVLCVFLAIPVTLLSQNPPEIGSLQDVYLYNGSGTNYIFLPQI